MLTLDILLIVVLVFSFIALAMGYYFSNIVINPKKYPLEDTYQYEIRHGGLQSDIFEKSEKEEIRIRSPYGYTLYGLWFPVPGSKKTVIIAHAFTHSLYGSVKYMDMFYKKGFNVLLYEHRNHGRSGGTDTTYGFYEKYDMKTCTDWVFEKCGKDAVIGIHGVSMGASIALMNAAIDPRIAFCIADCPYSDLSELFNYRLRKDFGLTGFLVIPAVSFVTWMRNGMIFDRVSPMKHMDKIDTPIFFIHGENDSYIPKEMTLDMYDRKKGVKKFYLVPDAEHAEGYRKNREAYEEMVEEFLEEIGVAGRGA